MFTILSINALLPGRFYAYRRVEVRQVHPPVSRRRCATAADRRPFVLGVSDVNICIGVMVANRLYDLSIPVVEMPLSKLSVCATNDNIDIDQSGWLRSEVIR